jgi:cytochrome c-type biogenesis protein CcmH/NrfG
VYHLQNRLHEALQAYSEVLKVNSGNVTARMNLAKTYREMGRSVDARREFEAVLKVEPANVEAAAELRSLQESSQGPKRSYRP